jgi:tRNA(Ile)-lysidine synthase
MIENSNGTKSLDLPGDVTVRRVYDRLDFHTKKEHNTPSAPSTKKLKFGAQKFGIWTIKVAGQTVNGQDSLTIDAETFANLFVRTRRPGDKIAKKGLGGNKKLQDLFVDAKIDRAKRDTYPLIVDSNSGEVLWVPGLAKSGYKPKDKTDIYQITIEEADHETKKD